MGKIKNYTTNRIIVKFNDNNQMPYGSDRDLEVLFSELSGKSWNQISKAFPGIKLQRAVTTSNQDEIKKLMEDAEEGAIKINKIYKHPNLHNFLKIVCPVNMKKDGLINMLRDAKNIDSVYAQPWPFPADGRPTRRSFKRKQRYLNAARLGGVDAKFASAQPGGNGTPSVTFVDLEDGWDLTNLDLPNINGISTIPIMHGDGSQGQKHGSNILGVVLAQKNNFGIDGIAPDVTAQLVSDHMNSTDDPDLGEAVGFIVPKLKVGDVLLIPLNSPKDSDGNFRPVEFDPLVFGFIQEATSKGVVVIEAAGNGNFDLDTDPKFMRGAQDSGAIMVASVHSTKPYKRFGTSNFGTRIDCFAWGEKIVTTDPGDGNYNFDFKQTSAASAIIAGVALSVQGMQIAKTGGPMHCSAMRELFRNTGTSSSEVAGKMPDLKAIHAKIQSGTAGS